MKTDFFVSVNHKPVKIYKARVSAMPFNQRWSGYEQAIRERQEAFG